MSFLLRCIKSTFVFDAVPSASNNCCTHRLSGLLSSITNIFIISLYQWYIWGYSLAFTPAVPPLSPGKSWYGGDSRGVALHDSLARPVGASGGKIPELLYQFYEGMFASFT